MYADSSSIFNVYFVSILSKDMEMSGMSLGCRLNSHNTVDNCTKLQYFVSYNLFTKALVGVHVSEKDSCCI